MATYLSQKRFCWQSQTTPPRIFSQIAGDKGFDLLTCEVMPDHVHLFVSLPPTTSVANAVKIFKGISARKLRMAFPELKASVRGDHLWGTILLFWNGWTRIGRDDTTLH